MPMPRAMPHMPHAALPFSVMGGGGQAKVEVAHSSKRQNKILPTHPSQPTTTMSEDKQGQQKRVEKLDVESDQDREARLGKLHGRGLELTTGSLFASMTRPEEGSEGVQMPTERTRPFAMPQSDGEYLPHRSPRSPMSASPRPRTFLGSPLQSGLNLEPCSSLAHRPQASQLRCAELQIADPSPGPRACFPPPTRRFERRPPRARARGPVKCLDREPDRLPCRYGPRRGRV